MKQYTFECVDTEAGTTTTHTLTTESDSWIGYNGPMMNFMQFLQGLGFIFGQNAMIGIMNDADTFISADDES